MLNITVAGKKIRPGGRAFVIAEAAVKHNGDLATALEDVPVGYSDHSQNIFVPIAAIAKGAAVIQKHFTLNNDMPGPDHILSLNPGNFRRMVKGIRAVEQSKGSFRKAPAPSERNLLRDGRGSLVALKDIAPGETITKSALTAIKPADGLPPKYPDAISRKKTGTAIGKSQPIQWWDIA